jgi:hypothetical protein
MRSKDMKYLGLGLGIGTVIMSLFLGTAFFIPGFKDILLPPREFPTPEFILTEPQNLFPSSVVHTQIPISTNTYEFIPTDDPTSTALSENIATPAFTPTLTTAELLAANGELSIVGPLSRTQQLNLYNAALTFIAPTYEESKKMSVAINGLRFSDPNTTCGPLAIAILQRAQIIGTENVPHDFFLVNPDNGLDRQLLEKTFPNEHYTNTRYRVKLNQVDWMAQPLMPGDFLYIYAGEQGNFEHMLVVTRVDHAGRAYSVTNYNTDQGFIINEVLLYDPAVPSAGIFAEWTKRKDQLLGSTGFAGFEVWRFIG